MKWLIYLKVALLSVMALALLQPADVHAHGSPKGKTGVDKWENKKLSQEFNKNAKNEKRETKPPEAPPTTALKPKGPDFKNPGF